MIGPRDGQAKFNLYKSAKIFISSSHFDTGNLALDEALSCGVSAVAYDIPHYYYPQGVVLMPCFDTRKFSNTIVYLLKHPTKRKQLGRHARIFGSTMGWPIQAKNALNSLEIYTKHKTGV